MSSFCEGNHGDNAPGMTAGRAEPVRPGPRGVSLGRPYQVMTVLIYEGTGAAPTSHLHPSASSEIRPTTNDQRLAISSMMQTRRVVVTPVQ